MMQLYQQTCGKNRLVNNALGFFSKVFVISSARKVTMYLVMVSVYAIYHFMLLGHEGELHYSQTSSGAEFCPGSDVGAHRKGR